MTTLVFEDTRWVLTVKLALVWPADTVTLDGTVATDVLLLESVTVTPPEGTAAERVTVPVELFPPLTRVGLRVSEESVTPPLAGLMVSEACWELLPSVAVITAVVVVVTDVVVTVKFALVDPAATVTLLGTLAEPLLLESETTDPPEGAALESVTVPCEELPPVTLLGFNVTEETVGEDAGVTVKVACLELDPRVAVIVTLVFVVTVLVLTVKFALVWPDDTVTLEGTVATDVLLLESETVEPPEGAAELRVTVPVELFPPVTLVGFRVTDETVGEELPGFTVKLVDTVVVPDWAYTGAVQLEEILVVPMVKVPLVLPAGIVTIGLLLG
jgi:hypothetical protein